MKEFLCTPACVEIPLTCHLFVTVSTSTRILTLRLHSGTDQRQRVTCQLSTSAGHGTTSDQHRDPWVHYTSVPVQPSKLQSLLNKRYEKKVKTKENTAGAVGFHVSLTS